MSTIEAKPTVSVILPTFNESKNIIHILDDVAQSLPSIGSGLNEVIVVDDNSPDGTAELIEHNKTRYQDRFDLKVIKRVNERGLSSAVLKGIDSAAGQIVVVMDSDMSHPPSLIKEMVEATATCDVVVASRYVSGGAIKGWSLKRKVISKGATKIAHYILNLRRVNDPMSGYFAIKKAAIEGIRFDALGYKILMEILVKKKNLRIKELPYVFQDRRAGTSKLSSGVMTDYLKAVWRLYRYDSQHHMNPKKSVLFISKAARFYTVGATGLLVNLALSFLLSHTIAHMSYMYATAASIMASITSNFVLNKVWTFSDRDFRRKRALRQYSQFVLISLGGAALQLALLPVFVEYYHMGHTVAQLPAVMIASIANFILNKKLTFKERVWG